MALRAGPVGLLQEGGGHNVDWLGCARRPREPSADRLDFGEFPAGGWQLAAGVVRPPGGVGRH